MRQHTRQGPRKIQIRLPSVEASLFPYPSACPSAPPHHLPHSTPWPVRLSKNRRINATLGCGILSLPWATAGASLVPAAMLLGGNSLLLGVVRELPSRLQTRRLKCVPVFLLRSIMVLGQSIGMLAIIMAIAIWRRFLLVHSISQYIGYMPIPRPSQTEQLSV